MLAFSILAELKQRYEDIKKRHLRYRVYNIVGLIALFMAFFGPGFVVGFFFMNLLILVLGTYAAVVPIVVFLLSFLLVIWLVNLFTKKTALYMTTMEERTFLKTYPVVSDLDAYFSRKVEDFRGSASKKLSKVIMKMEEDWTCGDFGLIKREVGQDLEKLQEQFNNKLLPAIRSGEENDLREGVDVLINFCRYLIDPSLGGLKDLNIAMEKLRTLPRIKEARLIERFFEPFPTRFVFSLASGLVAVILGSFIIGAFCGISILDSAKNNPATLAALISAWAVISAAIMTQIRRK